MNSHSITDVGNLAERHLLLVDDETNILLPLMTGVEFLSQVKKLYPETVRIVLSGYADLKLVIDAINKDAIYKFLTKPWEDDLLRANTKEAFQHYELRSENTRLSEALQNANQALVAINHDLEQRVEQKGREVVLNLNTLQLSQEMLENLPTAVIIRGPLLGFDHSQVDSGSPMVDLIHVADGLSRHLDDGKRGENRLIEEWREVLGPSATESGKLFGGGYE